MDFPDRNIKIDQFTVAVMQFCTLFFDMTEEQAAEKINQLWQKEDLENIISEHPFFLAGRLAGCENFAIREMYIDRLTEIDCIWM